MWNLLNFIKPAKSSPLQYDRASESNIYTIGDNVRPLADEIAEMAMLEKKEAKEDISRSNIW